MIRRARSGRFTLADLARRSGTSMGLLSTIERGGGNPSFDTLLHVADALGMPLVDLLALAEDRFDADRARAAATTADGRRAPSNAGSMTARADLTRPAGVPGLPDRLGSMILTPGRVARVHVSRGLVELRITDLTGELHTHSGSAPLTLSVSVIRPGDERATPVLRASSRPSVVIRSGEAGEA